MRGSIVASIDELLRHSQTLGEVGLTFKRENASPARAFASCRASAVDSILSIQRDRLADE